MGKVFTCAMCDKEFEGAWTDEEALTEMKENFGDVPEEDQAVICDDCYQAITIGGKPIIFN